MSLTDELSYLDARSSNFDSTQSQALKNYEDNQNLLEDMIDAGESANRIASQTRIVKKLRDQAMAPGADSEPLRPNRADDEAVREFLRRNSVTITNHDENLREMQEFLHRNSVTTGADRMVSEDFENEDFPSGHFAERRRAGQSIAVEAKFAVPASKPTQLPRSMRLVKDLDPQEVSKNLKIHHTWNDNLSRHARLINTTNKSTINEKKKPPPRSTKDRLKMPNESVGTGIKNFPRYT